MFSFLKRLFARRSVGKKTSGMVKEATLEFDDSATITGKRYKHPEEDVHKLMIKATGIRKNEGYSSAILFLKDIAEAYLREGNTALVTCMNKLIPYMKRDSSVSYAEAFEYLDGIIRRAPGKDPYFLALHITMAELIKSQNIDVAVRYLEEFLENVTIGYDHCDILIKLIDLYIEKQDTSEPRKLLPKTKELLDENKDRYEYIKMERKWFRSSANFHYLLPGENGKIEYLYNRFVEFILDMARALDPIQISLFHHRKDLYHKKERGFEDSEKFNTALQELGLENEKETIIKKLYGYAFEELPLILHVTEKQLHFESGQEETIEELREKKLYSRKPFLELPQIENYIRNFVDKLVKR